MSDDDARLSNSGSFLIVPGLGGSDAAHWQSYWERDLRAKRVVQANWNQPELNSWLVPLAQAVEKFPQSILVGHSLGCVLIAHLTRKLPRAPVRGAFLVAPADVDHLRDLRAAISSFAPLPKTRLPFPSLIVASSNDPYSSIERAHFMAESWGSDFADIGPQGHINAGAGFGPWPEGQKRLLRFADEISFRPRTAGRQFFHQDRLERTIS